MVSHPLYLVLVGGFKFTPAGKYRYGSESHIADHHMCRDGLLRSIKNTYLKPQTTTGHDLDTGSW